MINSTNSPIFETADDVLEHFGVKGQKWGVRRHRSSSSTNRRSAKVSAERKKLLKRSAVVAGVAGVFVAGAIIAHRGGIRTSSLPNLSTAGSRSIAKSALRSQSVFSKVVSRGSASASSTIGKVGAQKVANLPGVGARSPRPRLTRTATNDIAALRTSIASSIRGANAELRSRDNDLNIPIHQRSYLTEWD